MIRVRNKALFVVAILLGIGAAIYALERVVFLLRAERTVGTVAGLTSENGRCGSRRHKYPCTRFKAVVQYEVRRAAFQVAVSAGSRRQYDQPVTLARYQIGHTVPVIYSPGSPSRAYRDTNSDIWGGPLIAFFSHIALLFGSFVERRRRYD